MTNYMGVIRWVAAALVVLVGVPLVAWVLLTIDDRSGGYVVMPLVFAAIAGAIWVDRRNRRGY